MLERGAAKKLVIYVKEREKYHGEPMYEAVVRFLHRHKCAGATVTKAVAGYGASGEMHTAHLFHLAEDVPMRIEAIDSEQKITALLPFLYEKIRSVLPVLDEMVDEGLVVLSDVEIIKYTHTEEKQNPESRIQNPE